ncbi:MAG: hypothetical protein HY431_00910 [Candidatus Levybacteria bacterium]|nr:hypothetical protein [Candidatus Levybacteria bacterium]
MSAMKRDWDVLLIGGSAGTGKTTLAKQLSDHYNIRVKQVDDIRLAMQEEMDPKEYPDLFAFIQGDEDFFKQPHDMLAEALLKIGEDVWAELEKVIEKHLDSPVIIEGDGIIPELLHAIPQENIRAIFLYDDQEQLKQRERERKEKRGEKIDGRPDVVTDEWLERYTGVSYQFGQKIKSQAEKYGYPAIRSSPIETLLTRTLSLLNN